MIILKKLNTKTIVLEYVYNSLFKAQTLQVYIGIFILHIFFFIK